jgi:hypothetical protein
MTASKTPVFKSISPIIIVFFFVSLLVFIAGDRLGKYNIDQAMLITGNTILFITTLVSFNLYRKALYAGNTHAFLRNVYGSMFLKLFVCIAAVLVYVFSAGHSVNKPGLFGLLFLYLVYTFLEVGILMNQSKQIKQNSNA